MTTKVLVLVNGPSYEVTLTKRNSAGQVLETTRRRGGVDGQGVIETYLGTDMTIEIVEHYAPVPNNDAIATAVGDVQNDMFSGTRQGAVANVKATG